jgi:hypothetical protein
VTAEEFELLLKAVDDQTDNMKRMTEAFDRLAQMIDNISKIVSAQSKIIEMLAEAIHGKPQRRGRSLSR